MVGKIEKKEKLKYYKFLNSLPKKLNKLYFSKLKGKFKLDNKLKNKRGFDPVTNIDKAFELFLRKEISKNFPNDGILGEEFGEKISKSGFSWIIDPIDGTRSFVIGNPTWSNLISLNYNNKPKLGLANFPMLKKYYISSVNGFSFVFENNKNKKINVNKSNNIKNIKVAGGFHGYLSLSNQKLIPKVLKIMNFPCTDALSYCHLCEGKIDVVIQCANKVWDIHALIPIIKNAGGEITKWNGNDAISGGNVLVSANKKIHKHMLKLLKPLSKL